MKSKIFKIGLLHCFLATVISCNSNADSSDNNAKKNIDATYIKDSLAIERQILAFDTPYNSVDILIIQDATSENENSVSFSSQTDGIGQVLSGGKPIDTSVSIFYPYAEPTYKVSQRALHYLAKYVDENCICRKPGNDDDPQIFGVYYFKLIQGGQTKTCYVYLKDIDFALEYFRGLNVWLASSKYNIEFEEFFVFINRQIRELQEEKGRRK